MHRENDKIERYKTYLRLEKALSANSIDAYLTDLDKLTNFVESEGKKYADVTYDDLQQFVARLHDIGIHPRSQARIISGIKSFYRFLFLSRRGTALSRIMVFHIIKQQTEMAGIKKNVSPHTFRHSFATHLLEGGANLLAIQEMLGHEKITTTEIYTHIDRQFLRKEILEHHPRSKPRD